MSDELLKELIANLPDIIAAIGAIVATIFAAIGAIVAAYFGYYSQRLGNENKNAIEVVRLDVNSKMEEAMNVLAAAKFEEGKKKGLEEAADKKSEFEKGVAKGKEDKGSRENPIVVDMHDEDEDQSITPKKESKK